MSPLDSLVLALSENGTRVSLSASGSLRLSGTPVSPALMAEVKAHKSVLVALLREVRDLARDLVRDGDVEEFAAELSAAERRGGLSITDRYAARLALTRSRRWLGAAEEEAA